MVVDDRYPISPEMIDTFRHLYNTFSDYYVEAAAIFVIRLAQSRGKWDAFSPDDVFGGFNISLLLEKGLVVKNMGTYRVTHDLVAGAFLKHPVPYIGFRES